jgi:hypothetical protein
LSRERVRFGKPPVENGESGAISARVEVSAAAAAAAVQGQRLVHSMAKPT